MILQQAKAQLRKAKREAEQNNENWTGPVNKKSSLEFDDDGFKALKDFRQESGDDLRTAKRKMSYPSQDTTVPKRSFEWNFTPGDLVKIKTPYQCTRSMTRQIENLNLSPNAVGVIIEVSGRYLKVMGPMGLQTWSASWVNFCDE